MVEAALQLLILVTILLIPTSYCMECLLCAGMEHHHHLGAWSLPGGGPAARQPAPTSYSIKREFSGATVFMTGASGYIGSVLLEQLLRTTDVAAVYLLLRPRRGVSTQQRADALLQGALFHKVRCCWWCCACL